LFHSENDGENIERFDLVLIWQPFSSFSIAIIFFREWTEEEDQKLLDFIEENGQKFERAGGLLNRTRFSCHRRYNFLKGHPPPLHGHSSSSGPHVPSAWNDVEISRLYSMLGENFVKFCEKFVFYLKNTFATIVDTRQL
jgi:hypothetical protein